MKYASKLLVGVGPTTPVNPDMPDNPCQARQSKSSPTIPVKPDLPRQAQQAMRSHPVKPDLPRQARPTTLRRSMEFFMALTMSNMSFNDVSLESFLVVLASKASGAAFSVALHKEAEHFANALACFCICASDNGIAAGFLNSC